MTTGIRGILAAIISPGDEAKKMIKELGIEFDAATLKTKGFSYILLEMQKAVGDDVDKMEKLAAIFPNIRGLIGALALDADKYTASLDAMAQGTEEFNKATKTMMDTTENQLAILKNNMMAKLKPLGDIILGTMNDIAKSINIAMSGATDELSKLSRSYSELTDTLKSKQNRIDDLIATIEDLRGKTKLSKEETTQLHAAEKALAIYFPTAGKAAEGYAGSIDVLSLAKQGTIDLSIRIMELDLAQAKIEMRRADLAKELYDINEDKGQKEIDRINKRIKAEKDLTEFILTGGITGIYKEEQLADMMEIRLRDNNEYLKLEKELANATEKRALEEDQLIQNQQKSYEIVDTLTESLKELKITREKPIVIPDKDKDKDTTTTAITTVTIDTEEVEKQLKYMASQYKLYLSDLTEHKKEWIKENNAQLVIDAENYGQYLSDMLEKYKGNAELTKSIEADIYEYNKIVIEKRKKLEDELYAYITEVREKELNAEKDSFDTIIKNYKEGSSEYLSAIEKHKENEKAINLKYDKEIADAKLVIFKAGLEQQIGESDEVYKERYEKQLIAAKAEIGKETDINKIFFKFIHDELNKIAKEKEEQAKIDEATLASYLDNYRTTEEKIAAIHTETNKLIELTDDEATKNRLENIGKQKIAEIEFADAMEKLNEELAGYKKDLDNKGLGNYIKFLEEMKVKYSDFADIIILLNEKIAESQKQIWENVRSEIDSTASALHSLADIVGNFDTELESMINNLGNLVSGVGAIASGFAMGGIGGIATAIGGIATVISTIINLFTTHHSDVPEIEEELHKITLELQAQQTILSQSSGTAKTEAIQDTIDLLHEQIATYNEMIAAEEEAYGQFLWFTWSETDQAKIEQWLSSIQDINSEIANLNDQYNQILTGTTASAIADAIAEGFSQGLNSAQIFANTFNEMMKKAIMDAFKRTIITQYIENWYKEFSLLSGGISFMGMTFFEGLSSQDIGLLGSSFQIMLGKIETEWAAIQAILAAAGIDIGEAGTIDDIAEQAEEAMKEIAGITEETMADAIAAGFGEGLDSAELFANTFNDMMRKAIIDAFKETIIAQYLKGWMAQFDALSGGGLTTGEIASLASTYQTAILAAGEQWEAMQALMEAAGIQMEEIQRTGLTGAIAGITEETAGLLAGQFMAIRINTVEVLSNMESIIIINSQIADNTSYNRYLENIWNKMNAGGSLENETLRGIGGV